MNCRFAVVLGSAALLAASASARMELPAMGAEAGSRLAASELFEFHSAFWPNLHDRLYEIAQSEAAPPELCDIDSPARRGWNEAVEQYQKEMGSRHHRTDPLMRAIRVYLAGFSAAAETEQMQRQLKILGEAAPAFRACFWADQQDLNRQWVNDLLPRLATCELTLRDRLTGYFKHDWRRGRLRVDVLPYASWAGANTIGEPDHVQVSSINPGYREWSALEMVFHEASHLLIGGPQTEVTRLIADSSRRRDAQAPVNLWHALLFHTVGRTVQDELQKRGQADYEPYVYRGGLFRRAWSDYQKPIEDHWQPYLNGQVDLETAVDRVVADALQNLAARLR